MKTSIISKLITLLFLVSTFVVAKNTASGVSKYSGNNTALKKIEKPVTNNLAPKRGRPIKGNGNN
jgi:predicted small secreted protein